MILRFKIFLFVFGLLFSSMTLAQGTMIREFFACNYLEGKDLDDLMAARDYAVERMGDDWNATTFLWTPVMTDNELDFLWFNQYDSMEDWGNDMQGLWNTPRYNDIIGRFNSMSSCVSGIVTHNPMYQGGSFQPASDGNPVVVSFACSLRDGGTMQEVNSAVQHYQRVMNQLGTHSNFNSFMQTPVISSSGRDVYFFGVYPSFQAYARGTATLTNSTDYASVSAHFQSQLQCATSLWEGRVIVQPQ